jgi:hypothetical protein
MSRSPKSIFTLGSQVCFLSTAGDESTWIHGSTSHSTNVTSDKGWHIPLKDIVERSHTKGGWPYQS